MTVLQYHLLDQMHTIKAKVIVNNTRNSSNSKSDSSQIKLTIIKCCCQTAHERPCCKMNTHADIYIFKLSLLTLCYIYIYNHLTFQSIGLSMSTSNLLMLTQNLFQLKANSIQGGYQVQPVTLLSLLFLAVKYT